MDIHFTTGDFGSEQDSMAAVAAGRALVDPNHVNGRIHFARAGQPDLAIPDDLPFLVPDLCQQAPLALERTGAATVQLINERLAWRLQAQGASITLTGPAGQQAVYPRAELLAALTACGGRFADFLEALADYQPQFEQRARLLREALPD